MKKDMQNIKVVLFTLIVSTISFSCARKIHFNRSAVAPAAEATVKVKKDRNNNYMIDLSVEHLAPPNKLSPPKDYYVAWIETNMNGTKNIGQLRSKTGFLSNALKASLETTTPFKPTRIFITAEEQATISQPWGQVVLSTDNF